MKLPEHEILSSSAAPVPGNGSTSTAASGHPGDGSSSVLASSPASDASPPGAGAVACQASCDASVPGSGSGMAPCSSGSALLTPEEMAQRLNVSRRCLGNWARDRIIPMVKIGRVCRFDLPQVMAALEKHTQAATTR